MEEEAPSWAPSAEETEKVWKRAESAWENLRSQSLARIVILGGHVANFTLSYLVWIVDEECKHWRPWAGRARKF